MIPTRLGNPESKPISILYTGAAEREHGPAMSDLSQTVASLQLTQRNIIPFVN